MALGWFILGFIVAVILILYYFPQIETAYNSIVTTYKAYQAFSKSFGWLFGSGSTTTTSMIQQCSIFGIGC